MDEILIEGKKYVSSKQAAKMTGYAKDYVGQLCREGRVPARLVGRGWYVLESAIQDHRFGNQVELKGKESIEETVPAVSKTWEFPRYEAARAEILPSINRLNEEKSASELPIEEEIEGNEDEAPETPQNVHDSWKQWFDIVAKAIPENKIEASEAPIETMGAPEEQKEEEGSKEVTEDTQVNVPLRVVSNYFPPKEIMLEDTPITESKEPHNVERKSGSRVVVRTIQTIGVLVAMISISLACAGSGYLDAYLISNSQADILLGVTVYNK
jgi:hypothetical protein